MAWTEAQKAELVKQQRRESAFHEAGHALVVWLEGRNSDLVKIDMRGNGDASAFVRQRGFAISLEMVQALVALDAIRGRAKAALIICHDLAGDCAANRACKERNPFWFDEMFDEWDLCADRDPDHDAGKALVMAQAIYGDTGRAWAFLRRCAAWTDDLLSEPHCWAVVEALAERLTTTKVMTGGSACRVMEKAWGDCEAIPLFGMGQKWRRRFLPTVKRPKPAVAQ